MSELEALGYRWAHRVISLTGFGFPQRRRRVFIVASVHGDPRDVLLAPQSVCLGQCLELNRGTVTGQSSATVSEDDGVVDATGTCVDCDALDAVVPSGGAWPRQGGHGDGRNDNEAMHTADLSRGRQRVLCRHATRECYECFMTPPFVTPRRTMAVVDLAEKRHGPILHEIQTLTTSNGRRMCVIEDLGGGKGRASMLHIDDAERLLGLPVGWTKPSYPLNLPGRPIRATGDVEASLNKRMSLLGIAVAVPQARWIGERLMHLYDLKFSRAGDGVPFRVAIPGGPAASVGGVTASASKAAVSPAAAEAAVAQSAWPDVAWNVLPVQVGMDRADREGGGCRWDVWRGRRSLAECGDSPVIRGFIPLGEFIRSKDGSELDREQAAGYCERLIIAHDTVEPFIANALGLRRPRGIGEGSSKLRSPTRGSYGLSHPQPTAAATVGQDVLRDAAADGDEGEYGGKMVWIPTKVGRTGAGGDDPKARRSDCFWPGLSLHLDDDRQGNVVLCSPARSTTSRFEHR